MRNNTVLFDMDGLLLDTERVCLECCVEVGHEFGLPDLSDVFISIIGLRGMESTPILTAGLQGRVEHDVFCHHWDDLIEQRLKQGIPVKSGASELLQHLKANGVRTAVATSTRAETARQHLEMAQLLDLFDEIIGGDQVANGKPDPEIYHKAAEALGQSAPDCIIFEDSDPGVLAAVRSGARVVQVPDIKPPSDEVVRLGHTISGNLLAGAKIVGLI